MPIYEYECNQCGNVEEVIQKMSDAPLETCPHCRGRLSKIISHSSFHLKGSGWYVTDYGGGSSTKETANKNSQPTRKETDTCSGAKCSASGSNSQTKE